MTAHRHAVSPASQATSADVIDHTRELETASARMWLGVSTTKLVFLTIGFAALVFLVSFGLDVLLVREGESRRAIFAISDMATSLIIAGLFFLYAHTRRKQFARRLETIALMNHHIRNALQVISASAYAPQQAREMGAIEDSVNRIQWALREILPKL